MTRHRSNWGIRKFPFFILFAALLIAFCLVMVHREWLKRLTVSHSRDRFTVRGVDTKTIFQTRQKAAEGNIKSDSVTSSTQSQIKNKDAITTSIIKFNSGNINASAIKPNNEANNETKIAGKSSNETKSVTKFAGETKGPAKSELGNESVPESRYNITNMESNNNVPAVHDSKEFSLKKTICNEGKIYVSNEFYDCNGFMKDSNFEEKLSDTDSEADKGERKKIAVPTKIQEEVGDVDSGLNDDTRSTNKKKYYDMVKQNQAKLVQQKFFLNCGGTFPWAVELFLDTYPNASSYKIYSFVPDKSFSVMYQKYDNHTFIEAEAFTRNKTENADVKSFAAGSDITQTFQMIDISEWIETNVKQSDTVILRLESNHTTVIVDHLRKTNVSCLVDKLYISPEQEAGMRKIRSKLASQNTDLQFWDPHLRNYSDFDIMNPLHIPVPGKSIQRCISAEDEKIAFLLFSASASVNVFNVISLMRNFSPNNQLDLTIFLPCEMFRLIDIRTLLPTFHVGLYYDSDGKLENDVTEYIDMRNKATFVRRLFQEKEKALEYILVGNKTSRRSLDLIQQKHHFSVLTGGVDITHLTEQVLAGKTIYMEDTGKENGDLLMIDMDKKNAEYLVLYMARRFAPWLMNLSECKLPADNSEGELMVI